MRHDLSFTGSPPPSMYRAAWLDHWDKHTVAVALTQNDDDAEVEEAKRQRGVRNARKSVVITPGASKRHRSALVPASGAAAFTPRSRRLSRGRRSLSGQGRSPFTPGEAEEVAREHLSEAELAEMYANCIRLSAAGKINQNNVWSLNLIDYIDDVIQKEDDVHVSMFQKASRTLDASVKIYSCRVDSVHNQLYRVLGGLSRSDKRKGGEDVQDDDGDDADGGGNKRKKARPKGHGDTLVKAEKVESINVTSHDLNYEVDPMFFKMASQFDESGAKGLLLNSLQVHNGTEIAFDSDVQLREKAPEELAEERSKDGEEPKEEDAQEKEEEEEKKAEPPVPPDGDAAVAPAAAAAAPMVDENEDKPDVEVQETDEQLYGDTPAQLDALGDLWRAIAQPIHQIPICKTLQQFKKQKKVFEVQIDTLKQRSEPGSRRDSIVEEPERVLSLSDSEDDLDEMGEFVWTTSQAASQRPRPGAAVAGGAAPVDLYGAGPYGGAPLLPPPAADDDFGGGFDDGGFGGGADDDDDDDGVGNAFAFAPGADAQRQLDALRAGQGSGLQNAINQEAAMRQNLREEDGVDEEAGAAAVDQLPDIQRNFLDFGAELEPAMLRNWAGPSHWKYKRPQKTEEAKRNQKRKEKKTEFLDLLDIKTEISEDFFAPPKKGSNCLSDQVLKKNRERTFNLPEDLHLNIDFLHKLFLNPNMRMGRKRRRLGPGGADDDDQNLHVHWYNFANGADFGADGDAAADAGVNQEPLGDVGAFAESNDFHDSGPDDDGDDMDHGDLGGFDAHGAADDMDLQFDGQLIAANPLLGGDAGGAGGGGLKLVDAPSKVKQIDINYATTAKRVDVRNLKSKLWVSLQTEASRDFDQQLRHERDKQRSPSSQRRKDERKHEDPDAMRDDSDDENADPNAQKPKVALNTFQDSISRLGELIPTQSLDVVSVPYCFICLLHLANEKNLKFTPPTEDAQDEKFLGNFRIERSSAPDPVDAGMLSPPSKGSIRSYFSRKSSAKKS